MNGKLLTANELEQKWCEMWKQENLQKSTRNVGKFTKIYKNLQKLTKTYKENSEKLEKLLDIM